MAAADIIRGVTSAGSGGTITGFFVSVTAPTGGQAPQAGDKLIVGITTRDVTTSLRVPAGFTQVTVTNDETSGEGLFFTATYGDGTGGTVTGTSWTFDNGAGNTTATKWAWSLVVLRGDMAGSLITAAAQGRASTGTNTPTPSISTGGVPAHLVAMSGDRITGGSTWTWPAGWVEQTDILNEPSGSNIVSSSSAVYNTTPAPAGSYSVTPVNSTSGGVGYGAIFAFAEAPPTGPVAPVANFTATPTTGNFPLAVQFTDTSTGTPTSWAWTFGDGTTSTAQNPSKTYSAAGTYNVTLTATNATGSDAETKTGYIVATTPGSAVLPGSIYGIPPEVQGRLGPYKDANGNLYTVTEEYLADGNNPMMMKSSNGGETWAEVDAANAPEGASLNDLESGWLIPGPPGVLVFAWTDDAQVFYCTFNTSDAASNPDTWQIKAESAVSGLASGSRAQASIARLSDGRIRAVFLDTLSGTNNQVAYATKSTTTTAGGWSAKTALSTSTNNFGGCICVTGASDKLHIFTHDIANRQILHRTLTSAESLSANTRVDTAGTNTASANWHALSNAVYYNNAGTEVISVLYAAATGLRLIQIVGGVVTDSLVTSSAVGISIGGGADAPHCHLAVNGTTLEIIWVDDATGDLMHARKVHGSSTTTPTTLWASGSGTAQWVYCNVYPRGTDTVMGYMYDIGPHLDDGGDFKYNEMVLPASGPANLDDARIGSSLISAIRIGTGTVSKLYVGATQIWP